MSVRIARIINSAEVVSRRKGWLIIKLAQETDLQSLRGLHIVAIDSAGLEKNHARCVEIAKRIGRRYMLVPLRPEFSEIELFGFDHGVRSKRFRI